MGHLECSFLLSGVCESTGTPDVGIIGKTDDTQKRQEEWMADNKNMDNKKTFISTFDLINLSECLMQCLMH